ncbi:hypothetical protein [Natronobacterium gregoryi]|nr:hypothetical protein [Natronobacterium gregoryi]AFZ71737.1 hypothetical protein Natgr_0483 [Natronobacterium gregoryi SP2]SFI88945.1 hypothetical protein SAMN05443661_10887 [Natronobacterium gregoryi]
MTEDKQNAAGDSRRAFIKNGILAATTLAVGAGSTSTSATAAPDDDAFLHGRDYYPDVDFEVLTQFGTGTRNDFLEEYDPDGDVFTDVDDWEVFVVRIEIGESEGELGHLMIDVDNDEPDVDPGDSGTMGEIGSFRDRERNLIETEVDF